MSSPNGGTRHYRVQFTASTSARLKELVKKAIGIGLGQKALSAAKAIIRHLQSRPTEFGEPLYRLPALKLQVRVGIVRPLVVHYAVHEEKPLVFIKGFAPLPRTGL